MVPVIDTVAEDDPLALLEGEGDTVVVEDILPLSINPVLLLFTCNIRGCIVVAIEGLSVGIGGRTDVTVS